MPPRTRPSGARPPPIPFQKHEEPKRSSTVKGPRNCSFIYKSSFDTPETNNIEPISNEFTNSITTNNESDTIVHDFKDEPSLTDSTLYSDSFDDNSDINAQLNASINESIRSISPIQRQRSSPSSPSIIDSEQLLQDEGLNALHRQFLSSVETVAPLHIGKKKSGQSKLNPGFNLDIPGSLVPSFLPPKTSQIENQEDTDQTNDSLDGGHGDEKDHLKLSYYDSEYDFSADQSVINDALLHSSNNNNDNNSTNTRDNNNNNNNTIDQQKTEPKIQAKVQSDNSLIHTNQSDDTNQVSIKKEKQEPQIIPEIVIKSEPDTDQVFIKLEPNTNTVFIKPEPDADQPIIKKEPVEAVLQESVENSKVSTRQEPQETFRQAPIEIKKHEKPKISLGPIPYLGPELAQPESLPEPDFNTFFGINQSSDANSSLDDIKSQLEHDKNKLAPGLQSTNPLRRSTTIPAPPPRHQNSPTRTSTVPASRFPQQRPLPTPRMPSSSSLSPRSSPSPSRTSPSPPRASSSSPRTFSSPSPTRPLSSPSPPRTFSSPSPPRTYSSPSHPRTYSSPSHPRTHSSPSPPRTLSSPSPPRPSLSSTPSHIYSPNSQRRPSTLAPNTPSRSPLPAFPSRSSPQILPKISNNPLAQSVASSRCSSVSSISSFASALSSPPSPSSSPIPPAHNHSKNTQKQPSNSFHSAYLPPTPADVEFNAEYSQVPCSVCQKPIYSNERVVQTSAMTTLHLSCFRCQKCHMSLEHSQFYVYDTQKESEADPNTHLAQKNIKKQTKFLYCHLDYHELFSPRCNYCSTPIEGSAIFALEKYWHDGHFFCGSCNTPFEKGQDYCIVDPTQAVKEGKKVGVKGNRTTSVSNTSTSTNGSNNESKKVAWCLDCFSNKTSVSCWKCSKILPQHNREVSGNDQDPNYSDNSEAAEHEPCIEALGRTWCTNCFACEECNTPFETSEFILRQDGTLVCFSCEARRIRSDVWR